MPAFGAKDVQALRQATGAGMMDAKRALTESDGDFDAAARWLREQGLAASAQRADRANEQGAVAVAREGGVAAIVELRCETDFVAKSPDFTALVHDLAQFAVDKGEDALAERQAEVDQLKVALKENVELGRVVRFEAAPDALLDTYLHVQHDRGVNAVVVEMRGGDQARAHDVALHVASARPRWLRREDVPPEEVEKEREVLEALTRNEGKPTQAVPKIVEGRLNGFFRDACLLEQAFVKEPKRSVRDHLGGAEVTRFAQVEIGR